MSEPETASLDIYSPVVVPSTSISICFIPSVPFKYFSKVYSIPAFPNISFWSYISSLPSNSLSSICPILPIMCDAVLPSG